MSKWTKRLGLFLLDKWFDVIVTGGSVGATYNRIIECFPSMNTFYIWLICWAVGLVTFVGLSFRKHSNPKQQKGFYETFMKELLVKLKNNSDVEKLANGSFNSSRSTFEYKEPIREFIYEKNWVFNQDLASLIPEATKRVRIGFEVIPDQQTQAIKGFDIFVKFDGKFDKLDSIVREIDFDVSKTHQLEFYFSLIEGCAHDYKSYLLIKSITL